MTPERLQLEKVLCDYVRVLRQGDWTAARALLDTIPAVERDTAWHDVTTLRFDHRLPLPEAAAAGALPLVQYLLQQGAQVNAMDLSGRTALYWACLQGHWAVVETLLAAGADITLTTEAGTRVLDLVLAQPGGLFWAQQWVAKGQSLNYSNARGDTPLHFAARSDDTLALAWVLEHTDAQVNQANQIGRRPLDECRTLAAFEMLRARYPADPAYVVYQDGDTSLHTAARHAEPALLDTRLQLAQAQGVTVTVRGQRGNTLLHEAAASGEVSKAQFLLQAGAQVNAGNQYKETPLHWAVEAGRAEMVRLLLESGAECDAQTHTEFVIQAFHTPLFLAVGRQHQACVEVLLAAGANPNRVCDASGSCALTEAVRVDSVSIVRSLLAAGAHPDGVLQGASGAHFYFPLALARSAQAAELLLQAGAQVNYQNSLAETALHWQCEHVQVDVLSEAAQQQCAVIETLLQWGADVWARNAQGLTPLEICKHWAPAQPIIAAIQAQPLTSHEIAYWSGLLCQWSASLRQQQTLLLLQAVVDRATTEVIHDQAITMCCDGGGILFRLMTALDVADLPVATWPKILAIVTRLLVLGANPNAVEARTGMTPLHRLVQACARYSQPADREACWSLLILLLDYGADPHCADAQGCHALDYAVDPELIDRLQARGCSRGRCLGALMHACQSGAAFAEVSRLLALSPEGLHSRDREGMTPLMLAAAHLQQGILEAIFTALAKQPHQLQQLLNDQDQQGLTALAHLLAYMPHCDNKLAQLRQNQQRDDWAVAFVQHGARLDLLDADGDDMLAYAASQKQRQLLLHIAATQSGAMA